MLQCVGCLALGIGSVAVLPLNASGRFSQFPLVAGHSRQVTDFTFSPFHDYKLITGSEDGLVKLWDIPEEGLCNGGNRISTSSLTVGPLDVSSYKYQMLSNIRYQVLDIRH